MLGSFAYDAGSAPIKAPLWTLAEGLDVVRQLQPVTWEFGYHLALGGGVVNRGSSTKDLDLYFLPLDNGDEYNPDYDGLKRWLDTLYGEGASITNPDYPPTPGSVYRYKREYAANGKRIDVFIIA